VPPPAQKAKIIIISPQLDIKKLKKLDNVKIGNLKKEE